MHLNIFIVLAVTLVCVTLGLECTSPVPSGSSLSLADCTISTAALVVNASLLGAGGARSVVVSNVVLAGQPLVIAGWLAASPTDIARVDFGSIMITVTNLQGAGRLVVSGNFPNETILAISSSSIALSDSVASGAVSADIGCTDASTRSSALCIAAPSLTCTITIGPDVSLSNSWTLGSGITLASALATDLGDFGFTGRLAVVSSTLTVTVPSASTASSAAAMALRIASNQLQGSVSVGGSQSIMNVSTASTSTTHLDGIVWSSPVMGGGLIAGGSFIIANTSISVSGEAAATSIVMASAFATRNASGLMLERGVEWEITQSQLSVDVQSSSSSTGGAYTICFPHPVTIVRQVIFSIAHSQLMARTWGAGNATAIALQIVGVFPSLMVLYNNTMAVSTMSTGFPSAIQLVGLLDLNSQMIVRSLSATVYAASPSVVVIVFRMNFDTSAVGYLGGGGTVSNDSLTLRNGGGFSIGLTVIDCNNSANAVVVDGTSLHMIDIYVGGSFRYVGVNITGTTSTLYVFNHDVNKIRAQFNQLAGYTFVVGCFGVNGTFPIYVQYDYMADDTLDQMTNSARCDCALAVTMFGPLSSVGGTYPNCVANCTHTSTAPFEWAKNMCAPPYVTTASVTITTRTIPPQATVTTMSAILTPSRRSETISLTQEPPTPTLSLPDTLSERVVPTPSATFTDNASTKTITINATSTVNRTSRTWSRATPTSTHTLNTTESPSLTNATMPLSATATPIVSSSGAAPSETHTLRSTPTMSLTPNVTVTRSRQPSHTMGTISKSATASEATSATESLTEPHNSSTAAPLLTWTHSPSHTDARMTITVERSRHTQRLTGTRSQVEITVTPTRTKPLTATRRIASITASYAVPPEPFLFVTQSQALGFVTLGVTTVASLFTGNPTVIITQFIAVVGQAQTTGENAKQRTEPMAHIVSPFWSLGSTAVAAGNIVAIAVIVVLHYIATRLNVLSKLGATFPEDELAEANHIQPTTSPEGGEGGADGLALPIKDGEESAASPPPVSRAPPPKSIIAQLSPIWGLHEFPQLSLAVVMVFYQGLTNAAFAIFYREDGPIFVIGTLCIILTIALPLMLYFLMFGILAGSWPVYRSVVYDGTAIGWAFPGGYWATSRVKRCFGRLFTGYTDRGVRLIGYPLGMVLLVNATANANAIDQSQRDAQFGILGLIFIVAAVALIIFRPHRNMVTNVVYAVVFVFLMIFCACLANEATSATAADGVPVLIVILEVLLWCHGIYELVVWYSEYRGVLFVARVTHSGGDESGMMRTRQTGVRADAKKANATKNAFDSQKGDSEDEGGAHAITVGNSHTMDAPLLMPFKHDDDMMVTSSALLQQPLASSMYQEVEMASLLPVAPTVTQHTTTTTVPSSSVVAPAVRSPQKQTVDVFPPPTRTVTPPPSSAQPAAEENNAMDDLFAAATESPQKSGREEQHQERAPPSLPGLLQRDPGIELKRRDAAPIGGKKSGPAASGGKPTAKGGKKPTKGTKGRRGQSSSSSDSDLFGSSSDDSDL